MNCPQCNSSLIPLMRDCLFCGSLRNRAAGWPAQSVTARETLHINVDCEALKTEVAQQFPETNFDLRLGREQVRIPEMLTYRNLSISGVAGTRKTQVVNSLLQQLRTMANQKCLLVDFNGYFYSRFGQPWDKVLSLDHQQSEAWDFCNEEATPEFFAEALIEPNQSNGFFSAGSQALVTDLLKLNNSVEGLWRDLTSSLDQLIERIEGGFSTAFLRQPDQVAGVQAMAVSQMNFLQHLNFRNQEREPFSLTQWATSPSNEWVFLLVRVQDLAESSPLLRLWFELAILGVLQRDDVTSDAPHLWLIADELPELGKLSSVVRLLAQTRPHKASVVASYVTANQLENIYGRDEAATILQGFQNKLDLFVGDDVQNLSNFQAHLKICSFPRTRIQFDVWSSHT